MRFAKLIAKLGRPMFWAAFLLQHAERVGSITVETRRLHSEPPEGIRTGRTLPGRFLGIRHADTRPMQQRIAGKAPWEAGRTRFA